MKKYILLVLFSHPIHSGITYAQSTKYVAASAAISCNPWLIAGLTVIITAVAVALSYYFFKRRLIRIANETNHFYLRIAHDIRTPLTLIKAPLDELHAQAGLPADAQANVTIALRNLDTLAQLTTNLIELDRVDTDNKSLFVSEHELNEYMEETIKQFLSCAAAKHITLTYESRFEHLHAWFDKEKMDSILKNILSNAIKYTPENGKISVTTERTSDGWSVSVKDTGISIPASEQKKLTTRNFRHLHCMNHRTTGSGGIGLLLIARLTKLHKGKIKLQSKEGEGTLIRLSFPKDRAKFPRALQISRTDTIQPSPLQTDGKPTSIDEQKIYQTEQSEAGNNLSRPQLLIIEENADLREQLLQTLSGEYTVQASSDGLQALEHVKKYAPDLIISDVVIPGMRGDDLCRTLKNDIETSHIPFILLTALNHEKNIIDGLMSGADEYIVKPFNAGILKATIANLLNNRALLRQKYAHPEINNQTNDDCINCATDLDWKFILTVRKHVRENMENPAFNVDVLCNLMNMSRTSFYNKIKALTDQAPADYVRLVRLTHSAQLLQEQRYSITEIAEKTGFNDAKYFREVFKKHFKVSPSQYAKKKKPEESIFPE